MPDQTQSHSLASSWTSFSSQFTPKIFSSQPSESQTAWQISTSKPA